MSFLRALLQIPDIRTVADSPAKQSECGLAYHRVTERRLSSEKGGKSVLVSSHATIDDRMPSRQPPQPPIGPRAAVAEATFR
jgi:hypothetical protein